MAPGEGVDDQPSLEKFCKSCNKSTKSDIKCVICFAVFHGSCAVRIAGTRVVGYNDLHCSECLKSGKAGVEVVDAAEKQYCKQLIKTNDTLNAVILQLMADQDLLKSELQAIKGAVCDLTAEKPTIFRQGQARSFKDFENRKVPSSKSQTSTIDCRKGCTRAASVTGRGRHDTMGQHKGEACETAAEDVGTGCRQTKVKNGVVEEKKAYAAALEEATRSKLREICDLGSVDKVPNKNDWYVVGKRGKHITKNMCAPKAKNTNSAIIGTSKEPTVKLKSVPRTVSLYVTRLSPETSTTNVVAQLVDLFPEVKAEEMPSKYPETYKSFKVTVYTDSYNAIMSPDIWPEGVRVDKFFYRRSKTEMTK